MTVNAITDTKKGRTGIAHVRISLILVLIHTYKYTTFQRTNDGNCKYLVEQSTVCLR